MSLCSVAVVYYRISQTRIISFSHRISLMKISVLRLKKMACRLTLFDWGLWFGGGLFCVIQATRTANGLMGALAVILLTPGIAQLAGHRWAWHAGLVSFFICAVGGVYLRLQQGLFTIWTGCFIVGSIWAIWQHWGDRTEIDELRRKSNEDVGNDESCDSGTPPKNSLVLWLKEPRFLDASILSQKAERAFGVTFGEGEDAGGFVVGQDNHYILRLGGLWFIIHYCDSNYFGEPDTVAKEMDELRRVNAVRLHRAWLSMDYLRGPAIEDTEEIMSKISTMVFELAGDGDVLALYHPKTGRIAPWSDELKGFVADGAAEKVFEATPFVPVIRVKGDSDAMAAAEAEARKHWPEFLAAFHAAKEKDGFSVKAPVTEAGNTEYIWISVRAISEGRIHGFLGNDPVALGALKIGDFVSVAEADLNDWCYPALKKGDRPRGLFTVSALR